MAPAGDDHSCPGLGQGECHLIAQAAGPRDHREHPGLRRYLKLQLASHDFAIPIAAPESSEAYLRYTM
jgi:hypothetical protein